MFTLILFNYIEEPQRCHQPLILYVDPWWMFETGANFFQASQYGTIAPPSGKKQRERLNWAVRWWFEPDFVNWSQAFAINVCSSPAGQRRHIDLIAASVMDDNCSVKVYNNLLPAVIQPLWPLTSNTWLTEYLCLISDKRVSYSSCMLVCKAANRLQHDLCLVWHMVYDPFIIYTF